jgi:hypothetical protein
MTRIKISTTPDGRQLGYWGVLDLSQQVLGRQDVYSTRIMEDVY